MTKDEATILLLAAEVLRSPVSTKQAADILADALDRIAGAVPIESEEKGAKP